MAETTPAPANVEQRLIHVETDLNHLERKLKRGARVTLVVSVLLLVFVGAYFTYGYREFSGLLQANELVATVAGMLDEGIEPARESLQAEIEKSAPVWAEQLSAQAIEAVPELEKSLEEYILERADQSIDQLVTISDEEFDALMEKHRSELQALVQDVAEEETASDEVIEALQVALNEELGQDMQAASGELLEIMALFGDRLHYLGGGSELTSDEIWLRNFTMTVRRILLEQGSPDLLGTAGTPRPALPPAPTTEPPQESTPEEKAASDTADTPPPPPTTDEGDTPPKPEEPSPSESDSPAPETTPATEDKAADDSPEKADEPPSDNSSDKADDTPAKPDEG